jgi:hypothetical protein
MTLLLLFVFGFVGCALFAFFTRIDEVFTVSLRGGRALVIRGRIPQGVLNELCEVLEQQGVKRATVRGLKAVGHTRLVARGVDGDCQQRLRNVFGLHPISKGLSPSVAAHDRNLGQRLGWTWLSWLLFNKSKAEKGHLRSV